LYFSKTDKENDAPCAQEAPPNDLQGEKRALSGRESGREKNEAQKKPASDPTNTGAGRDGREERENSESDPPKKRCCDCEYYIPGTDPNPDNSLAYL
jgi:hypothetical protein